MATPELLIFSIAGDTPPQRVTLAGTSLTIGREPGNDLALADSSVSRQHVEITQSGDAWYVSRQSGAGPVLVNGRPLDRTSLQPGDQIVLGNSVLRFEEPGAPQRMSVPAPGAAPRPLPLLAIVCEGQQFEAPLHEPSLTLGRAPDCAIVVPSPMVSGHHARLERGSDGGYRIEDMNSTNGLALNGATVTAHTLRDGDTLTIGDGSGGDAVTLRFVWPGGPNVSTNGSVGASGGTVVPNGGAIRTRPAIGGANPQGPVRTSPPPVTPAQSPQGPQGPMRGQPFPTPQLQPQGPQLPQGPQGPMRGQPFPPPQQQLQQLQQQRQPPQGPQGPVRGQPFPAPQPPAVQGLPQGSQPGPNPPYFPMQPRNLTVRAGGPGMTGPKPPQPGQPRQQVRTAPISAPASGMMALIGRDPQATFCLSDPLVSWRHARIYRNPAGDVILEDLGATNGTFLNRVRITRPETLHTGARVQIGSFAFAYDGVALNPISSSGGIRLDVIDLVRTVNKGQQVLLDHVSLPIQPGEFLAITGGSGAGKTTLMAAMAGIAPAQQGQILYDGVEMRTHYDALRGSIGYVPQTNILHSTLSVDRALYYSAKLRLASDIPDSEIDRRIGDTLSAVNLGHRRQVIIGQLSGGEKRRLSIASEMLAEPPVIFMDEPAAGLDVLLQQGVRQNIKALTARGLTIVLVTHEPKDIDAADKVAVMGRGGRLCYYGKPANAQGFFGVTSFEDMLASVNDDQQADYWRRRFEASPIYAHEIRGVLAPPVHPTMPFYPGQPQRPPSAPTSSGGWDGVVTLLRDPQTYKSLTQKATYVPWLEQGRLLVRRGVEVLRNDRVNLLILLLQAPVMAVLLYVLSGQNVLGAGPDSPHFDFLNGRTVLLLLSVMAVFFGTNNAIREISKEGDIYERERLAGLGVVPYVMAKVAIFSALVALQTLVLVVIVVFKTGLPPGSAGLFFGPFVELYIGTLLAGLAGMAMGLCVSAFANNSDKAVAILPLVLLPQILLAGVIFPLPAGPAQILSDVAVSKWSLQAMGTSVDLNHDYYVQALKGGESSLVCGARPELCAKADSGNAQYSPSDFDSSPQAINYTTTNDDATTSWADSPDGRRNHLLACWFALLALTAIFLGAAGIRQRVKDPT